MLLQVSCIIIIVVVGYQVTIFRLKEFIPSPDPIFFCQMINFYYHFSHQTLSFFKDKGFSFVILFFLSNLGFFFYYFILPKPIKLSNYHHPLYHHQYYQLTLLHLPTLNPHCLLSFVNHQSHLLDL